MKKAVLALVVSLAIASVSILAAVNASAWGAESGSFPDRIFEVGKTSGVSSDWALYITSIEPTTDCNWWVELMVLGGSEVEVLVHELHENAQKMVSSSELTEVGQLSEKVSLRGNFIYYVTFKYIGKPGASILAERTDMPPTPVPTEHDPIYISGDLHFALTATEEGWAGEGTEVDPYIIENMEISGYDSVPAIRVQDTTVHFVIRGCEFYDTYPHAVFLNNVDNAAVQSSLFQTGPSDAIYCEACTSVSILDNEVVGGSRCIGLIRCAEVEVVGNTVEGAEWYPICIESSTAVMLRENIFTGAGIKLGGYLVSHWNTHDIDDSNLVNGGPVHYFKDLVGGSVPAEAGQIILTNCVGMTVQCDASGGITLGFSPDNTITGSAVSSVHWGLYVSYSPRTHIVSTSVSDCDYGVYVLNSPYCEVESCSVYSCDIGMYFQQSEGQAVLRCSVLDSASCGIQVFFSSYGEIRYNLVAHGLQLGISLIEAGSILVASNDFIGNTIQAYDAGENSWDDGYPTGGNYWSDYSGTDADGDGIGDTPYTFEVDAQDSYPLMSPFGY